MFRYLKAALLYGGVMLALAACGGGGGGGDSTPTRAVVDVSFDNYSAIQKINATPSDKLTLLKLRIVSDIPVSLSTKPATVCYLDSPPSPPSDSVVVDANNFGVSWIKRDGVNVAAGQRIFSITYTLTSGVVPNFWIDPTRIEAGTWRASGSIPAATPVNLVPADFKLTVTTQ